MGSGKIFHTINESIIGHPTISFPAKSPFLHRNNVFMAFISRITGNYRNWTSNFLSISKSSKNSHQFHLNFTAKYNFVITISGTSQSFDLLLIMLNPFLVSFKIRIHLNNGWEESIPRCDWVNSTLIQLSTTIPTRIGISDPKITCFSILGKSNSRPGSTGQSDCWHVLGQGPS